MPAPFADFAVARQNMIDGQLRPNGVKQQALLAAIARVPREYFVPHDKRALAYSDVAVPLGHGRTLPAPMVAARLLQELELNAASKVLVVAGGYGYEAALAACMTPHVTMTEPHRDVLEHARNALLDCSLTQIKTLLAPVDKGCPAEAPFDAILLATVASEVPLTLFEQLAPEGRLAALCPGADGVMEAVIFSETQGGYTQTALFETGHTPVLVKPQSGEAFQF